MARNGDQAPAGRPNQRMRTRKDLLRAASRLMKQGRKPSLDEVAEEALVSRATAYRYFASVDVLLLEASLDVAVPEPDDVLRDAAPDDPIARLQRVDDALHDVIAANEPALRMMLVNSLQRGADAVANSGLPVRQNRRTPLIEAALDPVKSRFKPANLKMLTRALALVIGTEAMVVFKDVLGLDDTETRKVKRWMIRALVDAARTSTAVR